MNFAPFHDDIGEVDGEKGLDREVHPKHGGRLFHALLMRHSASEIKVGLALDVADVVVVLVKAFLSAWVSKKPAIKGEVSLVAAVEDETADEVGKEEHVLGWLSWADPGHDPNKGNNGHAHKVGKENIPVLWENVDLESTAYSANDGDNTKGSDTTPEW